MKTVLTLALLLASAPAFASPFAFPVKCAGLANDGQTKIEVATSEDGEKLEYAIYPADRARNEYDVRELTVTKALRMFPIASIEAKRDARPVDGALVEAYLSIHNEAIIRNGGYPSRLTISSTIYDRRMGKEVKSAKVYELGCTLN